jgi:hypothetical protein
MNRLGRHSETTDSPKHAKAMEIARQSFRKYADTYKALANTESNHEAGDQKSW